MKKIFVLFVFLLIIGTITQGKNYVGKVLNIGGAPIENAVVTIDNNSPHNVDSCGTFMLEDLKDGYVIRITCDGYFSKVINWSSTYNSQQLGNVILISRDETHYNESHVLPFREETNVKITDIANIERKDFYRGSMNLDNALQGELTGLQVTCKSGMTGEGAMLLLRGTHSLCASSMPLVVINGIPYLTNMGVSNTIGGYSQSVFRTLNNLDIKNVSLLKGSEAAIYGSLAGNGVIMVETDGIAFDNMDMKISFSAMFGKNWNSQRIPMMNAQSYKSYLTDIGLTYYNNMEAFFKDFSFLANPYANKYYLYAFDTDYQDKLYCNSNSMDYLFRVQGGDAIAKYNISLGYSSEGGTLKNTRSDRYNAQINADVLISKKIEINAMINMAYMTGKYMEQGLSYETNPMLAAYRRSPLLSEWNCDIEGNTINEYASYNYGAINNIDFRVSNPVSIINKMQGKDRQFELNSQVRLLWKPHLSLKVNGIVGLLYNYDNQKMFIPGVTQSDIVPIADSYGEASNTVRNSTNHIYNYYFGANAEWNVAKTQNSAFNTQLGTQIMLTNKECDFSSGRNTASDYYQTMGDTQLLGKYFSGMDNRYNWLNFFLHCDYTWNHLLRADVNLSVDGASTTGNDASRMYMYPSGKLTFMADRLLHSVRWVNSLNLYTDYTITGNSLFSSSTGRYYYSLQQYKELQSISRANVPNTKIRPEKTSTYNIGFELSALQNRIAFQSTFYNSLTSDAIVSISKSAIFDMVNNYSNSAKLLNRGVEMTFKASPIYSRNWHWTLGASMTSVFSRVEKINKIQESLSSDQILTLSDGAQIITREGENPFSFYGYRALGVFKSAAEASAANLKNASGVEYCAGDVHYEDVNHDGIINDKDKQILGDATPDFFGNIFSQLTYKNWSLDFTLSYVRGNDAYNAIRRITSSGLDFSNQSTAMERRWNMDGQITDIPRVMYGDKIGNNDFSSRWIEDGSYLKLRNITLSYEIKKTILKFINGGNIYLTAENLFYITKYLGISPEFSYDNSAVMQGVDYGKVNVPRSIKLGFNLNF